MLEIQSVTRRFGAKSAVDDVSLTIAKGSFVGVIGRSGAGKSTLLRMINRLLDVSEGSIRWNGQDVTALQGAELRAWRMRCAMVSNYTTVTGHFGQDPALSALQARSNRMEACSNQISCQHPLNDTLG